jgi:hypothetical protein
MEEDEDNSAATIAAIFCALLWIFTICAGMWFCKPNPMALMPFRFLWWTLLVASVIDIICVGDDSWPVSILNSGTEKPWIIAGDFVNITACLYNLCILANWRKE